MAARMTGRAYFGRRLRAARERQEPKMGRRSVGEHLMVSDSAVAAWEAGRNVPDPAVLKAIEEFLGIQGEELQEIVECLVTGEKSQEYMGRWMHVEAHATTLLWFELLLIPGLLQTEEYARAVLRTDDQVEVRLERQRVLTKEDPPVLVALIDESVLRRNIGGPDVMRGQLKHLEQMAKNDNVIVQVVRMDSRICSQYNGPFILASYNGETEIAFVDDAISGGVVEISDEVGKLRRKFEIFRGYALSEEESIRLVREVAESWT